MRRCWNGNVVGLVRPYIIIRTAGFKRLKVNF